MTAVPGAALALALAACAQGAPPGAAGSRAPADTVRGVVEVVGAMPATSIVLMLDGGARAVALEGARGELERMQGLEVTVWGEEARSGVFRVGRTAVRAAHGVPTVDGVLTREGDGYVLVTAEGGRVPLPRLPDGLRAEVGSRVWIAGPPEREVDTFGVIERP